MNQVDVRTLAWRVANVVAQQYSTRAEVVLSGKRDATLVEARFVCYYLVKLTAPELSWPRIGEAFGRHHSTCLHGHDVVEARLAAEPEFFELVTRLKDLVLVGAERTFESLRAEVGAIDAEIDQLLRRRRAVNEEIERRVLRLTSKTEGPVAAE